MHALACLHVSAHCASVFLSLNNVETNLKTPHAHACSSAKSVHARACTFKALLHAFSFGVLIPLSTFLVPSCIQSDCVLSRSKSDDDTVKHLAISQFPLFQAIVHGYDCDD